MSWLYGIGKGLQAGSDSLSGMTDMMERIQANQERRRQQEFANRLNVFTIQNAIRERQEDVDHRDRVFQADREDAAATAAFRDKSFGLQERTLEETIRGNQADESWRAGTLDRQIDLREWERDNPTPAEQAALEGINRDNFRLRASGIVNSGVTDFNEAFPVPMGVKDPARWESMNEGTRFDDGIQRAIARGIFSQEARGAESADLRDRYTEALIGRTTRGTAGGASGLESELFGSGGAATPTASDAKPAPQVRVQQLKAAGLGPDEIYAKMKQEGY